MTLELKATTDAQGAEIRKLFDRSADYGALVRRIETSRASLARLGSRRSQTELRRLERAMAKLTAVDFYPGEAKDAGGDRYLDPEGRVPVPIRRR